MNVITTWEIKEGKTSCSTVQINESEIRRIMFFVLATFRSKFQSNQFVPSNINSMKLREGKQNFKVAIFRSKEISMEIC